MVRLKNTHFQRSLLIIMVRLLFSEVSTAAICLAGNFDSQVRYLLSSQMLTRSEIAKLSSVFFDLQQTIQIRWPGSEVIPMGSLITGLSMKASDPDCMVKVPHFHIYNETANTYLILKAAELLRKQPQLYSNVRPKFRKFNKISLLKFNYIPTQKNCDVNFISTEGLEISKMIADYYSLDDRAWTLAVLIKYWYKVHGIKYSGITSYSINLLIIFYLQEEDILPPFCSLRTTLHQQHQFAKCDNSKTVYQLLGGFFMFYNEYNFEKYVVSPFLGRSISKRELEDVDSLPEELSQYKKYMTKPDSSPIVVNTKLCIQDVFSQHLNVVGHVLPSQFITFKSQVKFAAVRYQFLPSDRFLSAILITNRYDKALKMPVSIDEIGRYEDCIKNKTVSSVVT